MGNARPQVLPFVMASASGAEGLGGGKGLPPPPPAAAVRGGHHRAGVRQRGLQAGRLSLGFRVCLKARQLPLRAVLLLFIPCPSCFPGEGTVLQHHPGAGRAPAEQKVLPMSPQRTWQRGSAALALGSSSPPSATSSRSIPAPSSVLSERLLLGQPLLGRRWRVTAEGAAVAAGRGCSSCPPAGSFLPCSAPLSCGRVQALFGPCLRCLKINPLCRSGEELLGWSSALGEK